VAVLNDSSEAAGHHLADRQLITDDIYQIRAVISGWWIQKFMQ
jgi:molybdenum cofactor biosynthesis protein B